MKTSGVLLMSLDREISQLHISLFVIESKSSES